MANKAKKFSRKETDVTLSKNALEQACQYTARFWADMLRLNLFNTNMQTLAQWLATKTNPLNRKIIDRFQITLEAYIYEELIGLDDLEEIDFKRWVGCWEHGPNTYLAEVCQALSISFLYFPSQTGWYVNPGRVINRFGEIRMV